VVVALGEPETPVVWICALAEAAAAKRAAVNIPAGSRHLVVFIVAAIAITSLPLSIDLLVVFILCVSFPAWFVFFNCFAGEVAG
jgi:hypothetical protein